MGGRGGATGDWGARPAAVVAVAAIVLIVACAGPALVPGTREHPRTVEVVALDSMAFDPGSIPVVAGETVRFVVTNQGNLEHEFAIGTREELLEHAQLMTHGGMRADTPTAVRLLPGETKEVVYTFGTDDVSFGCMVADHFPAGMSGTFVVGP
jgi:uncharacterized cupredoxin-like copper-binding protein